MGPHDSPPWRVYVSHTSELREFPATGSYLAAVERAVSAAGHVMVDLTDLAPPDAAPARLCIETVTGCDVYVGLLGMRYGSTVPDRPETSYAELEFDTAGEAGIDRLMFLIDAESNQLGIPPRAFVDREYGGRQDEFRHRVEDSGLTVQRFASPDELALLLERSLRELAAARERIDHGIELARQETNRSTVWGSKFVNPAPMAVPIWFQDRETETRALATFLSDPTARLMTVIGRGGTGKTALVCRLLKGLGEEQVPGVDLAGMGGDDIVYLTPNDHHGVDYPNLVGDLCALLPAEPAKRVKWLYENPRNTPAQVMSALLEALPAHGRVVVLLDDLGSAMDPLSGSMADAALHEALVTVLTAPAHGLKIIATTRIAPTVLRRVNAAAQRQLQLDEGLSSPAAHEVLVALDPDGTLGLRDAPDPLLAALRDQTHGLPRALEAVAAILAMDPSATVADVLNTTRGVGPGRVVEVLGAEAYERLDPARQQVVQALAIYAIPVSAVGVDFLLQPYNPTIDAPAILAGLADLALARHDDGRYHLQVIDRAQVRARISEGEPGDAPPAYTTKALRARAADYYAQIRKARPTWHSLDDVRPQLAEFDLRCDVGDFDAAATVLADIADCLQEWGHYRTLLALHACVQGKITDPALQAAHASGLGLCHYALGNYPQAISLHEDALRIDRQIHDRPGEAADLRNLSLCHAGLGAFPEAIRGHEEALVIDRALRNREGQAADLRNLGLCHSRLGDFRKAIGLHNEALRIDREMGDRRGQAADLGNLGLCHAGLGDHATAIGLHDDALRIDREVGDRQGEAADLRSLGLCHSGLGNPAEAIRLHDDALHIDRQIGNRQGMAVDLRNLGLCYVGLGDYPRAISLHDDALRIDREIDDRQGEAADLRSLGLCHSCLGDFAKAIGLHEDALEIDRQIGDRQGEAADLGSLGLCHAGRGDHAAAISMHEGALRIAREIGNRYLEAITALYLARVWLAAGEPGHAVSLFDEAIRVAAATPDIDPETQARTALARARLDLHGPPGALALTSAARRMGHPSASAALSSLAGAAAISAHRAEADRALVRALDVADATLVPGPGLTTASQAPGGTSSDRVIWTWAQQRMWHQTTRRLRHRIVRARSVALGLVIAAAALSVAAVQILGLGSGAGRTFAATAALSAALGTMTQRRAGTAQVQAWARAREACEGLKSEVYAYLAGGSRYAGDDRERTFGERTRAIVADAADLEHFSRGITPDREPVPAVTDIASYLTQRVDAQIDGHYRPTAARNQRRVRRLRAAGAVLGAITVILAGVAATFGVAWPAAWVPVMTTAGACVVAHAAAAGYDQVIVASLRTAQHLDLLRDARVDTSIGNAAFVDDCETAITNQARGWMAHWTAAPEP